MCSHGLAATCSEANALPAASGMDLETQVLKRFGGISVQKQWPCWQQAAGMDLKTAFEI